MKIRKILRKAAMALSLAMLLTSTIGTTYGYIVTKTDRIINVFVPNAGGVSGLTISKTVEHPLGDDYVIPGDISFDFNVELGSYYAGAKLNTTAGEMTADESGTLSVSVKPGTDFGLEGLEEGTVVTVTEKMTDREGFSVKEEWSKTVTVGSNGTASIPFVNTYTPDSVRPGNVIVSGVKVLEGRQWQSGDSFTFVLEQMKGGSWIKLGEKTVTYDGQNVDFSRFDFTDVFQGLYFDKVGLYSFRMSEVAGTLENMNYDKTVKHFTVKVTDVDMDGKLEIRTVAGSKNATVSGTRDSYAVFVTFNNTFVPHVVPDPINVHIGIDKIVNNVGDAAHGRDGFRFALKNNATAESFGVTTDSNGMASFLLAFTEADIGKTHTYQLSEINQGFRGMTYDTDVHEITVTVTLNENNELVAALTMDGKSVDTLHATFENTYNAQSVVVPPTGDDFNIMLWLLLMIVSGSALIALLVYERKRSRK